MSHQVNFNFTPEQRKSFNLILDETKCIHPHLLIDDITKERIKVLIAYSVINPDAEFIFKPEKEIETETNDNQIVAEEISEEILNEKKNDKI